MTASTMHTKHAKETRNVQIRATVNCGSAGGQDGHRGQLIKKIIARISLLQIARLAADKLVAGCARTANSIPRGLIPL
jgi:hypothetical protein